MEEDPNRAGVAPVIDPRTLPSVAVTRERLVQAARRVAAEPMFNPHHEPEVPAADRGSLIDSSVLLPFDLQRGELLLTRRASRLRFGGHVVFPGGKRDPEDEDATATALRESHEEIGLQPELVDVVGSLGAYCTHSGYRMTGVVGVVQPEAQLEPDPREVAAVLRMPLAHALSADAWVLRPRSQRPWRANFVLSHGDAMVSGPTVSLLLHLWRALAVECVEDLLGGERQGP